MIVTLTCSRCEQKKPPGEFYDRQDRAGQRPQCKECHREDVKRWQAYNPAAYLEAKRRYSRTHKDRTAAERQRRYRERIRERRDRLALQRSVGGSGA